MTGEIVAIEPELTQHAGMTVVIRGYDKSHRLHRGRKSSTHEQVMDSTLIQEIADQNGLECDVESSGVIYEQVFRDNQTDMEFIQERARRAGYLAYVENGKLFFHKSASQTPCATLEWGENLTDFQARLTSAGQVENAQVRGWDALKKTSILSEKETPASTPTVGGENHGGSLAQRSHDLGSPIMEVVNNRPVTSAGQADMLAQSVLEERCQAFFEAEGTCWGNTAIRAGKQVELKGLGQRFSGTYLVTRANHRYELAGYVTQFEISGYRANTLRRLLSGPAELSPYGVLVGIVTNVKDPRGLARVKVNYPTISDRLESNWARIAAPMAGPERGFQFIPEINDEVLVAFEHNDINRPYVIGCLWNEKDKPPESGSQLFNDKGEVQKRVVKSRAGHVITLDDTASEEKITIVDQAGQKIVLDSTSQKTKIEIVDKAGQKVVLDSSAGGEKVEVIDKTGKSRIVMDPNRQSVSIESALDLTIKATGKIQIDGQTGVNIKSDAGNLDLVSKLQTNIQGMQTSVQGTGTAEFKSSGALTVRGAIVNIN
jgi:phage protein D